MFFSRAALLGVLLAATSSIAQVVTDPGKAGAPIELVHLFYDEWPTGIAVSSKGRQFACYPGGLDYNDTNTGNNGKYTVAELITNTTEAPYPSMEMNNPPGGAINYKTTPPTGAGYANYLIGVQSVVIDSLDRLWILDTGRVLTENGTLVLATYGGPKLVGVDLTTNKVFQTIVFPDTVAFPDSYLNDVRFDLRPNVTASGRGIAYLTDSSVEGRTGLIVVDLGTGESWRHLSYTQFVQPALEFVAYVWGRQLYANAPGGPFGYITFGADGIAISADGEELFFGGVGTRYMYSIATSYLRDNSANSEVLAQQAVRVRTQKGVADGFETDTNNFIYHGYMEQEAISFYNPANGTDQIFVRDPRLNWVDTMSIATDGYLYFTVNQLCFGPMMYPGTDTRQRPFAMFRAQLPNGGTKIMVNGTTV